MGLKKGGLPGRLAAAGFQALGFRLVDPFTWGREGASPKMVGGRRWFGGSEELNFHRLSLGSPQTPWVWPPTLCSTKTVK